LASPVADPDARTIDLVCGIIVWIAGHLIIIRS
jgi:hypothetical protein